MICPSCGGENADGNWVCGHCGEALTSAAQPQAPGADPSPYREHQDSGGLPPAGASPPRRPGTGGTGTVTKVALVVMIAILVAMPLWYFRLRGPDTGTPAGTVEAYMNAASDEDCRTLYELTPNDLVPENRDESEEACAQFMSYLDFEFSDYRTLEETVDGERASVRYEITVNIAGLSVPDEMTVDLIREDGRWKVQPKIQPGG